MADVFISYAREDKPRAEQVARGLQQAGLDVFWDSEIPPGQTWADYIEEKLSNCKAVIVLWSANSTRSQWVREEARMGRDKGKLIPASLDDSAAPFGFGEVQAANLKDWNGAPGHPDWERMMAAVRAAVSGQAAPPPPRPQPSMRVEKTISAAYAPPPAQAEKKPWFRNPWILGGGAVVAALVILGVIGAMEEESGPPPAAIEQAQQNPVPAAAAAPATGTDYAGQLQAQLTQAGALFGQQGFRPIGAPFNSGLAAGATQNVPVTLEQGGDYRIIAVCDSDCSDIDLTVYDQNNNQVANDTELDDHPIVAIQPRWTGPFTVVVTMAQCSVAPCYYAAQLYGKPLGQ